MNARSETRGIIVHHSKSRWGTEHDVSDWHRERGFAMTGYHYLILNGWVSPGLYVQPLDGQICPGRPEWAVGAHCPPRNGDTIGICLIGDGAFSRRQFHGLRRFCANAAQRHGFDMDAVRGHGEEQEGRTCPEIPGGAMRAMLKGEISIDELQRLIRAAREE